MSATLAGRAGALAATLAALVAVWTRVHNARSYPADWGFDASFNWRYIFHFSQRLALPSPEAGWSTGDPPLYFFVASLLLRAAPDRLVLVPLLNALLGLVIAGLAALLVARATPGDRPRAVLAALLVLFLPAHVHMSVMVNEEMLQATLTAAALLALCHPERPREGERAGLARAARAGAASGLALLSKLTGVLAIGTGVVTCAWDAWRTGDVRRASRRLAVLLAVALALGGWFHARNRIVHGYFLPFGLPAHESMFRLPPGERGVLDYLRFPLATFRDPQLLNEDLLHSVWGSTYATTWFDGHRAFLPTRSEPVRRLGTLTLLLALLPTAAFGVGIVRGARRCLRGSPVDVPLVAITALSLVGYAAYTWRNPWFVVLKGTTLLGLCLPYAFYASETLVAWSRRGIASALAIGTALALLAAAVTASSTFGLAFARSEVPGLTSGAPAEAAAP